MPSIYLSDTRLLAATSMAAAQDDVRYFMVRAVYFERHYAGGVVMSATDGHRLIVCHDAEGRIDDEAHGTIVQLTKEGWAGLRKVKGLSAPARIDIADGHVTVTQDGIADKRHGLVVDGQFPQIDRVIPDYVRSDQDGREAVYLRHDLVTDFGRVAKIIRSNADKRGDNSHNCLAFRPVDGSKRAVEVLIGGAPEFYGVVMPVRTPGDEKPKREQWLDSFVGMAQEARKRESVTESS